ncbi:MAG: HAMP domain-containing protein, partial [Cyanobacteria bacterium P01_D01_bin.71]
MRPKVSISIGTKIFGVASSMLALLLGVTYLSYVRIRQVNQELTDIAAYLTPITENIAEINIHALEQEIHFERALRYYETEPLDPARITAEIATFEERGRLVDKEIAAAMSLADEALENAYKTEDVLEIARLRPLLTVIEADHQKLHEHSVEILALLEAGDFAKAAILSEQIEEFEDDFDARLQAILFELTEFVEQAAEEVAAHEQRTLATSWWLAGIASIMGLAFATVVTAGLVRPVRRLVDKTLAVEQGNLAVELPVYSTDEVGKLTDSFNVMVRDLREKERLKATFGQYVDPRIVETLLDQQAESRGGQRQMMTMFFSDIADFSRLSELLTPAGLVTLINQYLTLASAPIQEHQGVLNQFIGDAVSAFWGPPFVEPNAHAKLACMAALEQFDQLAKLHRSLPDLLGIRKGLPDINIRIGLASGELVAGNIG